MEYVEVEHKYPLHAPELLTKRLVEMGAIPTAKSRQVDSYYNAPHRDFMEPEDVSEWLRVRVEDGGCSLNYKRWLPTDAVIKTHCDEYESPIADAEAVRRTLAALDFTPMVTVDKLRQEWHVTGDTPVVAAIDTIDGLGTFVEFEFKGEADTVEDAIQVLTNFVADLRLPLGDRVHYGYPHMLLGRVRS